MLVHRLVFLTLPNSIQQHILSDPMVVQASCRVGVSGDALCVQRLGPHADWLMEPVYLREACVLGSSSRNVFGTGCMQYVLEVCELPFHCRDTNS